MSVWDEEAAMVIGEHGLLSSDTVRRLRRSVSLVLERAYELGHALPTAAQGFECCDMTLPIIERAEES